MGAIRVALAGLAWRYLLRPTLFLFPAESTHVWTMHGFAGLMKIPGLRQVTAAFFGVRDLRLRVRRFGLEFPNPVGLAAGLDKDAKWHSALSALGFGFIEVGTLTAAEQPGNPKPRVFRLKADEALLNRMGSPNEGAAAAAARLARRPPRAILGINIGKTAKVPVESAAEDYLTSFELLYPFASYFALNVSSPNTPGLRRLQETENLTALLRKLMERNAVLARSAGGRPKPLFVKIAPDLDDGQLDELVGLCVGLHLDGIIVANTTTSREGLTTTGPEVEGAGGISGRPLTLRARALVAAVYRKTRGALPIIGVGGIMTEDDAWQMIRAGASLIEVHSGLIHSGPGFVAATNRYLLRQLTERGNTSIEEVIGEASQGDPAPKNDRAAVSRPVRGPA